MDLLIIAGVVVAWIVLQTWLLPRLGIPTCAVPQPRRALPAGPDDSERARGGAYGAMATLGLKRRLPYGFDEALAKIPAALKAEGFGVLTEIDVQDTLKRKINVGFRRYRILGACNPPLAHKALSANLDVGVMLPCNLVVYEGDDGNAVVSAVDPMQTVAAQEEPQIREVAAAVADKLRRVLAQLG